jgi:ActR/RegA family two-component response regulator
MVALSGFGQEADVQRSKNAGFDLDLTKPASVDEIIRAIEDRQAACSCTLGVPAPAGER